MPARWHAAVASSVGKNSAPAARLPADGRRADLRTSLAGAWLDRLAGGCCWANAAALRHDKRGAK
ncbi:MAG: hypothetical protein WAO08_36320, partial [Hyphomicrobiaceae bacterium]